jgi:hypothetical protein
MHSSVKPVQIQNTEGLSITDLQKELENGGRLVIYEYCISVVFLTFKRQSSIYFYRPNQNSFFKALSFSFISLLIGWWGLPWGPIRTVQSFVSNLRGGRDVTKAIYDALLIINQPMAAPAPALAVAS